MSLEAEVIPLQAGVASRQTGVAPFQGSVVLEAAVLPIVVSLQAAVVPI